jgi:gliding motility-associated lipoprotein GldH
LDVKHKSDYAYQNIYLKIVTDFPDGEQLQQTLSVDLADGKGLWYGDCSSSSCSVRVVLQEQAFFDRIGAHTFKFMPYMRMNPVDGIEGLSMLLDQKSGTL